MRAARDSAAPSAAPAGSGHAEPGAGSSRATDATTGGATPPTARDADAASASTTTTGSGGLAPGTTTGPAPADGGASAPRDTISTGENAPNLVSADGGLSNWSSGDDSVSRTVRPSVAPPLTSVPQEIGLSPLEIGLAAAALLGAGIACVVAWRRRV